MPRRMESDVRIITEDEWARLMKVCKRPIRKKGKFDRQIFDGRRDEIMLRLLLDCGLRVSELAGLDLEHVDLDREQVWVVGKGSRPRVVPFSAKTGQAIDRYLRIRGAHRHASAQALLLAERGRITDDGIRWRLERLRGLADVPRLHPHALRHTFAHRWLMNGGQERDLMNLAGWKTDEMLQVYARTTATERAHLAHRRMRVKDAL
jgi:integrase